MINKVFDTLIKIIWIPVGIGVLGLVLMTEPDESIPLRVLGGLVALIFSPIMLVMFSYLIVADFFERMKYSNIFKS